MNLCCAEKQRAAFRLNRNSPAGSAVVCASGLGRDARPTQLESGGRFAWTAASARLPYLAGPPLTWRIASKQSVGTHLSAMTQKSLQGGRPVYSTSISKLHAVGKYSADSHELTVEMETPKSAAILLSGSLLFRRQLLKAVAKLARKSQ